MIEDCFFLQTRTPAGDGIDVCCTLAAQNINVGVSTSAALPPLSIDPAICRATPDKSRHSDLLPV